MEVFDTFHGTTLPEEHMEVLQFCVGLGFFNL